MGLRRGPLLLVPCIGNRVSSQLILDAGEPQLDLGYWVDPMVLGSAIVVRGSLLVGEERVGFLCALLLCE